MSTHTRQYWLPAAAYSKSSMAVLYEMPVRIQMYHIGLTMFVHQGIACHGVQDLTFDIERCLRSPSTPNASRHPQLA